MQKITDIMSYTISDKECLKEFLDKFVRNTWKNSRCNILKNLWRNAERISNPWKNFRNTSRFSSEISYDYLKFAPEGIFK